ncbi:MAG: 16S rRNA (uracil(1498)-N(3))-methyltransferase [Alphaproteobacteria bacterium]|nr:16S rRNA (uracil(1498)-N(3))-methyltransferase [Alphaproteobacteria bacterium]
MQKNKSEIDTAWPRTRLYVEADLGAQASVAAGGDQSHYLRHVLRLEPGGAVILFNGRDGEWLAHLQSDSGAETMIKAVERLRPQVTSPDLWLVFAALKRSRLDFLAEKVTELGVAELRPVITRHTMARRVNVAHLRARCVSAAQQSERMNVPLVHAVEKLKSVLENWPHGRRLLFCDESGEGPPIAEVLTDLRQRHSLPRGGGQWAMLTGPEGGFSPTELDALHKLPFAMAVGLGPRVLRADTAALAALACWQAILGDWHERCRFEPLPTED